MLPILVETEMTQDTTIEFGQRLERAVDGHPLAPPTPYGRQAWLLEKLRKETGLDVSANTISKWFSGSARPRPDNIRKIAQVLRVDEVWLALGRKPTDRPEGVPEVEKARGAASVLAGLIEMSGGRISYPKADAAPVDLHATVQGNSFDVIAASPTVDGDTFSFVVNEPARDARILAVVLAAAPGGENQPTVGIHLYDLTDAPRPTFGGFSVLQVHRVAGARVQDTAGRTYEKLTRVENMAVA